MEQYSASYANTKNNFVILNLKEQDVISRLYSHYCVVKNIIMRGTVTHPSQYLIRELGELDEKVISGEKHQLKYYSEKIPNWNKRIKGSASTLSNPAKKFFFEIIPKYLEKYRFIQSLILPEAMINEIVDEPKEEFIDQCVDFYLPQAKLVIEIDGSQHNQLSQKLLDQTRDQFLRKNGVSVVRIEARSIINPDSQLLKAIDQIKAHITCSEKKVGFNPRLSLIDKLAEYEKISKKSSLLDYYSLHTQRIKYEFVMRLQILILSLLQKGVLDIDSKVWNIKITSDFPNAKNLFAIAYKDVMLWLQNLCKLSKQPFEPPVVTVNSKNQLNPIKIDIKLFSRWSEDYLDDPETIFIRTSYYDDKDFFRVSTADLINYKINSTGYKSDLPYLHYFLKNIFPDFTNFRDGQLQIISYALEGNDCIGIMPTGAGKSLCYQFVCLLQPSINFIVSPLLSLIYDQKTNLDNLKIDRTNFVTSDQKASEKTTVIDNFGNGHYLMIWISPERFQTKAFRENLERINHEKAFAYAVIDEVHCVSEWGHDFRTSYLNLARTIRKYCPKVFLLGLTATASRFVLEDLKKEFEIDTDSIKTVSSMRRDNLYFQIIESPDSEKYNYLKSILLRKNEDFGGELFKTKGDETKSGIIFTLTVNGRNGCKKVAETLSDDLNINIKPYHGKLNDNRIRDNESKNLKKDVQDGFTRNEFPLLVATKAFGMGVNKKNIDYTIHYGLPWSIEAFYQEAGRAGRAEQEADCYIIYSPESCDDAVIREIFAVQTDIPRIKELSKYLRTDLSTIFYLWVFNNEGIEPELDVMRWVMRTLYKGTHNVISCNSIYTKPRVERAIYRLAVLGMIEDWTVLDWGGDTGKFEVIVSDFSEKTVKDNLERYIISYDSDFFEKMYFEEYRPYREILNSSVIKKPYVRYMKALLQWSYDNIAYQRRKAIENMLILCTRNLDNEGIHTYIESYFKFSEITRILDEIVSDPLNYKQWFKILFLTDQSNEISSASIPVSLKKAEESYAALQRYLESYRYNTGLNFLSGLLSIRLGQYYRSDAVERLNSAFNFIDKLDPKKREEIISRCIQFGLHLPQITRALLGEFLANRYPAKAKDFYKIFHDYGSLTVAITLYNKRLQAIEESII